MPGRCDPELSMAERYATLVPQFGTYPEAPGLHDSFKDPDYRYHIGRGNGELIPKPISILLHVPLGPVSQEAYVEQLLREIELLAPLFDRDREVVRLQLTGAPDRLDAKLLARVLTSLGRNFHVTVAAKVSFRVTFGGAPLSPASFSALLKSVCDGHPDSIELVDAALVLPRLAIVPAVDAATRFSMFEQAVGELAEVGYAHAYKDWFESGEPDDVVFDADQVGLGPASISSTGGCICQNLSSVGAWQSALDKRQLPVARGVSLGRPDRQRAGLLQSLLRGRGVDAGLIEQSFSAVSGCLKKLRSLEVCALVREEGHSIVASSRGRYLWRILARCFDPDSNFAGHAEKDVAPDVEGCQRGDPAQ